MANGEYARADLQALLALHKLAAPVDGQLVAKPSYGDLRPPYPLTEHNRDILCLPDMLFFLEQHDRPAALNTTALGAGLGWPYSQCGLAFGDYGLWHPAEAMLLFDDMFEALTAFGQLHGLVYRWDHAQKAYGFFQEA